MRFSPTGKKYMKQFVVFSTAVRAGIVRLASQETRKRGGKLITEGDLRAAMDRIQRGDF